MHNAELAAELRRLTLAAGQAILRVYAGPFAVREKADCSPVTAADEQAEAILVAGLKALTPGVPIVAEEAAARGAAPDLAGGRFWLVDPLDGTREFVGRNGEFTVNAALVEQGRPVLGVVHVPVADVTYVAEAPGRVLRYGGGGPGEAVTARAPAADGYEVLASRSHRDAETEAWLAGVKVKRLTAAGSSLKFCRIAEGAADLYPRLGPTMEWDTAAGDAVVTFAGGSVRTPDGAALTYGKPGFRNPGFIVRGRER